LFCVCPEQVQIAGPVVALRHAALGRVVRLHLFRPDPPVFAVVVTARNHTKRLHLREFSLRLSRACLDKKLFYQKKKRKREKGAISTQGAAPDHCEGVARAAVARFDNIAVLHLAAGPIRGRADNQPPRFGRWCHQLHSTLWENSFFH
jgi:hypothetical protein